MPKIFGAYMYFCTPILEILSYQLIKKVNFVVIWFAQMSTSWYYSWNYITNKKKLIVWSFELHKFQPVDFNPLNQFIEKYILWSSISAFINWWLTDWKNPVYLWQLPHVCLCAVTLWNRVSWVSRGNLELLTSASYWATFFCSKNLIISSMFSTNCCWAVSISI